MDTTTPRTSGHSHKISRKDFEKRFLAHFDDPAFDQDRKTIQRLGDIAWKNYHDGQKAPHTRKAGPEFHDPDYELNTEWLKARSNIRIAQKIHDDVSSRPHVLIINGSDRHEATCPGEISKSERITDWARDQLEEAGLEVKILRLADMTAEYGKTIYPCKACVSTAMPLCHWPCSCYPHQSLGQINDWMNDIYPLWVRAHGVMIITPVYWHQAPSTLKLMIDRLVCADGGNPDPTTTQGKNAKLAKELELQSWGYPRHLEGRLFSVIVHGDTMGVDGLKEHLTQWLMEMSMVPAGIFATLGKFIGYYEDYATSHLALDRDTNFEIDVKNAAMNLALSVKASRENKLASLNPPLVDPRPK